MSFDIKEYGIFWINPKVLHPVVTIYFLVSEKQGKYIVFLL